MSVPVRSTMRSTLLWAVVPAAMVYAVAQAAKAPLAEGFLSSVGYLIWMAAAIALFAASTR